MVELEAVSVLSTSPPGVSTHCSPIIERNVTLIPNDSLSRALFWATRVGSLVPPIPAALSAPNSLQWIFKFKDL